MAEGWVSILCVRLRDVKGECRKGCGPVKQREIAEQLNVSPATLSLVLNNKPGISDALRQKVLKDLVAAGHADLIKQKAKALTGNIAFVLFRNDGDIVDQLPFSTLVSQSMFPYAQSRGYDMKLFFFNVQEDVVGQVEALQNLSCDGAVIFATEMDETAIPYFSNLAYPCVFMDNFFEPYALDCVATNSRMGTRQAVDLLVRSGHKRIGYLKNAERTDMLQDREDGFAAACRYFGVEFCNDDRFACSFVSEVAERQILEALESVGRSNQELPTAFVSDDDFIAASAIRAFESSGYRIPDDVSIVGYANRPLAELVSPALTSVEAKDGVGVAAVKLLLQRIDERSMGIYDENSIKMRIGTKLVRRHSTGCV